MGLFKRKKPATPQQDSILAPTQSSGLASSISWVEAPGVGERLLELRRNPILARVFERAALEAFEPPVILKRELESRIIDENDDIEAAARIRNTITSNIDSIIKELSLCHVFAQAVAYAEISGCSYLYIHTAGPLETPLGAGADILSVWPLSMLECRPYSKTAFGRILMHEFVDFYELKLPYLPQHTIHVHPSRITPLGSQMHGVLAAQACLGDRVVFPAVALHQAGAIEANYIKSSFLPIRFLQIEQVSDPEQERLREHLTEASLRNVQLIARGRRDSVSITQLPGGQLSDTFDLLWNLISAATGLARDEFQGMEAGKRKSSQSIGQTKSWISHLMALQTRYGHLFEQLLILIYNLKNSRPYLVKDSTFTFERLEMKQRMSFADFYEMMGRTLAVNSNLMLYNECRAILGYPALPDGYVSVPEFLANKGAAWDSGTLKNQTDPGKPGTNTGQNLGRTFGLDENKHPDNDDDDDDKEK